MKNNMYYSYSLNFVLAAYMQVFCEWSILVIIGIRTENTYTEISNIHMIRHWKILFLQGLHMTFGFLWSMELETSPKVQTRCSFGSSNEVKLKTRFTDKDSNVTSAL